MIDEMSHINMDIVENIKNQLKQHVCPIYTLADAEHDIVSFAIAMGIDAQTCNVKDSSSYTQSEAQTLFGMSKQCYTKLLSCASSEDMLKAKNNKIRLRGRYVRQYVLSENNNCVGTWLCQQINIYNNIRVPLWFAYILLPLPAILKHENYGKFASIWKLISQKIITREILEFVKNNKHEDIEKFRTEFTWTFGSLDERKKMILANFDDESNLGKVIKTCELTNQMLENTKYISKHMVLRGWMSSSTLSICLDYIFHNRDHPNMESIIKNDGLDGIRVKMQHFNIDLYIGDNTDFQYLDYEVDQYINFNELVETFEQHEMRVLDDEMVWYGEVERVEDMRTGITTENLKELIKNFPYKFNADDIDDLREYFDSYYELSEALGQKGLTIRSDSKLCAAYVEDGTYVGPTDGVPKHLTALQKVVAMMEEMDFLFKYTTYPAMILDMKLARYPIDTDLAKAAAMYVYKPGTQQIPARLRKYGKRKMKEAYKLISSLEPVFSDYSESEYDY